MRRNVIPLGRILGIQLNLDYSWFLIFALLTWTLAVSYFPVEFSNWPKAEYWALGAVTAVMLFVSVVLHELGHSFVAQHYRMVVRSITLFIFGGVSEIASEPPSAVAEFWIAIAGPIVSILLAAIFTLVQPAIYSAHPVLALAKYLAYINASLAVFNLIPGFPLDGGRILRAFVWRITKNFRRATMIAANIGKFIAYGFILVGVWQVFSGNLGGGLWIGFIGWFLEGAAGSQLQNQNITRLLEGHSVREAMAKEYATVPDDETLQELVDEKIMASGTRSFIVEHGPAPVGLLTLHQVREIPREMWRSRTTEEQMIPLADVHTIRPEVDLKEALKEMDSDGVNQLPVMTNGHMVGLLNRESILTYLRNVQELGY